MNARGTAGRLLVGLTVTILLGGCGAGAAISPPSTPAATVPPPAAAASLVPTATATATAPTPTSTVAPTPAAPEPTTLAVDITNDVAYESANPALVPGELTVYAPAEAGPWPVVVMFHGAPGGDPEMDRMSLSEHARRVARLGFVVFNASWGHAPAGAASNSAAPSGDGFLAIDSQGACAVAFARAHAAEYGGDPATMVVFGHSGGAHVATMVAFARPAPTAGCLGGPTLGAIDALVTWEGNWLFSLSHPVLQPWDGWLAADPRIVDAYTPWRYLASNTDLKVLMLVSEDPRLSLESEFPGVTVDREVGDPWAADSWLAVRDPSGDLRRRLESDGAFADGTLTFVEVQQLLYSVLKAQGNPVTLDVMPESTHAYLLGKGWDVFLAAFPKAAASD